MTRNPAEPSDKPEPEGGRAAERLSDLLRGRFPEPPTEEPPETEPKPPDDGESGDDEANDGR